MKTFMIIMGLVLMMTGWFSTKVGTPAIKTVVEVTQRDATLATVNGADAELIQRNVINENAETLKRVPIVASLAFIWAGLFMVLLGIFEIPRKKVNIKTVVPMALILLCIITSGCRRPVNVPEYEEAKSSETVYVVPLEGDIGKQVKFDSAAQLDKMKVAERRILIEKRWEPQGRNYQMWKGIWLPTIKVIKVNRAPETVEWEAQPGKTGVDDAIWSESADSIGFSMGWAVTAYIKEENASLFLYNYPNEGVGNISRLRMVMDTDVRARIQATVADISMKYSLDELRNKKGEITEAVRKDVMPFFEEKGITIMTIGQFAGMTYENPKIQDTIDEVFIAQTEKEKSKAALSAQADKNTVIEQAAKAEAEAARTKAQGLADGNLMVAKAEAEGIAAKARAEAEGIEAINKAIEKSGNALLTLKQMDVDKVKYEKWSGDYPNTVIGSGANLWIGLDDAQKKVTVSNP
jgi:hypothetical protein